MANENSQKVRGTLRASDVVNEDVTSVPKKDVAKLTTFTQGKGKTLEEIWASVKELANIQENSFAVLGEAAKYAVGIKDGDPKTAYDLTKDIQWLVKRGGASEKKRDEILATLDDHRNKMIADAEDDKAQCAKVEALYNKAVSYVQGQIQINKTTFIEYEKEQDKFEVSREKEAAKMIKTLKAADAKRKAWFDKNGIIKGTTLGKVSSTRIKRTESSNSITGQMSTISGEAYTRGVKFEVSKLAESTSNSLKNLQEHNSDIQAREALTQDYLKKNNIAVIDFETTYTTGKNQDYDPVHNAPVTFGIHDGSGKKYGALIGGDKYATDRIMEMLTDAKKMAEPRINLAKKMGFHENGWQQEGNKIVYLDSNGKPISEARLRKFIEANYLNKLTGDENKINAKDINTNNGKNEFGWVSEDYNVISHKGIGARTSKYDKIVAANTGFDVGHHNMVVPAENIIDMAKTGDLFDVYFGGNSGNRKMNYRYAGGWTVENASKIFLKDFNDLEAHGEDADTYNEAQLLAIHEADPKSFDKAIDDLEKQIEQSYINIYHASTTENKPNSQTGDIEKRFTADYIKYHTEYINNLANSMAMGGNPSILSGVSAADEQYIKAQVEANEAFGRQLEEGIKKEFGEGYLQFAKGEITKKRLSDITGTPEELVDSDNIIDLLLDYKKQMNDLGQYVEVGFVDDKGVKKLIIRTMPFDSYSPEKITDKDYATMFDVVIANGESLKNAADQNSMTTIAPDNYHTFGVDETLSGAQAAFHKSVAIAKSGYKNKNNTNITAAEASKKIRRSANKATEVGAINSQGENNIEYAGSHAPSKFGKEKLWSTMNWSKFINDQLGVDKQLDEMLYNVLGGGRSASSQLDRWKGVSENVMGYFMSAMNMLANFSDDELKQYVESVEANGTRLDTDMVYQLLTSPAAEGFRKRFKSKANINHFNLESESAGNVKSGKALSKKLYSSEFQGVIGQDYSEAWIKTQANGKNTKKEKDVEKLTKETADGIQFWKKNAFTAEQDSSDRLVTNIGSLDKDIINQFYKDIGIHKGSSDDQFLAAQDWANTNEGIGEAIWSKAYLDVQDLKNLSSVLDNFNFDDLENGETREIESAEALTHDLKVNKNFVIPAGAYITGVKRDSTGKVHIQYRQSKKVKNSTKGVGDTARGEFSIEEETTADLREKLTASAIKVLQRKKEASISDLENKFNSGEINESDKNQALKDIEEEFNKELEVTKEVINSNVIFREDPGKKKQADPRVNPQYVATVYQNLFKDAEEFERISSTDKGSILKDFFEVLENENGEKYIGKKAGFNWATYKPSEAAKKLGLDTVEKVWAYVHSLSTDNGLLSDIMDVKGYKGAQKEAAMRSGAITLNTSGIVDFNRVYDNGGAWGSDSNNINEGASFRGTIALLRRTKEDFNSSESAIISQMVSEKRAAGQLSNGDAFDELQAYEESKAEYYNAMNTMLNSLVVTDQEAVDRANTLLLAAAGNNSVSKYNEVKADVIKQKGKIFKIGFGGKSGNGYVNFFDLINGTESPEDEIAFTQDEYQNSALKTIYDNFGEEVGNGKSLIDFDFSKLSQEQLDKLNKHGITKNLLAGLGRQTKEIDGTREITQDQRDFLSLISVINQILNGEDEYIGDVKIGHVNDIMTQAKRLKQAAVSTKSSNSVYLKTGHAAEDDSMSWISEGTARGLLQVGDDATFEELSGFFDKNGDVYNSLNKKQQRSVKNALKHKNRGQLTQLANDYVNQYVDSIVQLGDEANQLRQDGKLEEAEAKEKEAADKLNMLINRSPFLTQYSNLFNDIIVKSKDDLGNALGQEYDGIVFLTEQAADQMNADWDGDIIAAKKMMVNADEATKKVLQRIIDHRREVIKSVYEGKKNGEFVFKDDSNASDFNYQKELEKQSLTVTNPVLARQIQNIVNAGNMGVGISNYNDEKMRTGIRWYQANNDVSDFSQLGLDLYKNMMTQLGQQVGISAKQMGSLLIGNEGKVGFTIDTAKEIFNILQQKGNLGSFTSEQDIYDKMLPLLQKSMFTDYGMYSFQEAKSRLQAKGEWGNENSADYQAYMQAYTAYINKDLEAMFKIISSSTSGIFSSIIKNAKEVEEFSNGEFSDITNINPLAYKAKGMDPYKGSEKDWEDNQLAPAVKQALALNSKIEGTVGKLADGAIAQLSGVTDLLSQIITLLQSNFGGGASGSGYGYRVNEEWENAKNLFKGKHAEITGESLSVDLDKNHHFKMKDSNDSNHSQNPIKENGKTKRFISATSLANTLTSTSSPAEKAQLAGYRKLLDDPNAVITPNLNIKSWADKGFGNSKKDPAFTILASSLAGELYHAASEGAITAVQDKNNTDITSLDAIIDGKQTYDFTKFQKYIEIYDKLVKLFGGGEEGAEYAERYLASRGGIQNNLMQGLLKLREAGVKDDASNVTTEEMLGATYQATIKDKEGKKIDIAQNIGAILDNIRYDAERQVVTSIDLKQKPVGKDMAIGDIIEGYVQRYLLSVNVKDEKWAAAHGIDTSNTTAWNQVQENTKNDFTQFLKVSNGEAVLRQASLIDENMSPDEIMGALLSYYIRMMQNGGAAPLTKNDFPVQEFAQSEVPDFYANGNPKELINQRLEQEKYLTDLETKQAQLQGGPYAGTADTQKAILAIETEISRVREQTAETEENINRAKEQGLLTDEDTKRLDDELAKEETRRAIKGAKNGMNGYGMQGYQQGILQRLSMESRNLLGNVVGFSAATAAINKMSQAIKQAISYATELDKKLVDLQIATGNTKTETYEMLKQYNQLAKELGRTTSSVAEAANDWLRAGFTGKEATELITSSMYLSTLGMMDASEATSNLISVLKGWKLESSEVMGVVDKLVKVDMQAAVSAGDIATAMQNVNYSAQQAGLTMNTLIGILTTNQEITQKSADETGRAWRTIIARIQNVKAGKFAANASDIASGNYDESDWESLNDVETTLKGVGISLRNSSNSFKSVETILNEIAGKWGTFSDVEKSAISNAMAGTRQRENFIATMSNWDQVQAYAELAEDSYGTAAQKMEAYSDSVEAAKNRVTAALESFGTSPLIATLEKAFYNISALIAENGPIVLGITAILIASQAFAVTQGNISTLFGKMGGALTNSTTIVESFSKAIQNAKSKIKNFGNEDNTQTLANVAGTGGLLLGMYGGYGISQAVENNLGISTNPVVTSSLAGMATQQFAKSIASGGFNGEKGLSGIGRSLISSVAGETAANTAKSGLATLAGGLSYAGVGIAVAGAVYNAYKTYQENELKVAKETYQTAANNYSAKKSAATNAKRYAELAQGVNNIGDNVSLTDEEYSEFLTVSNELAEAFPELVTYTDSLGNKFIKLGESYADLIDTINNSTKAAQEAADDALTADAIVRNAKSTATKTKTTYQTELNKLQSYLDYLNSYSPSSIAGNLSIVKYLEGKGINPTQINKDDGGNEIGRSYSAEDKQLAINAIESEIATLKNEINDVGKDSIEIYISTLNEVWDETFSKYKPENLDEISEQLLESVISNDSIINSSNWTTEDLTNVTKAVYEAIVDNAVQEAYKTGESGYSNLGSYQNVMSEGIESVATSYNELLALKGEEAANNFINNLGYVIEEVIDENGDIKKVLKADSLYNKLTGEEYGLSSEFVAGLSYSEGAALTKINPDWIKQNAGNTELLMQAAHINGPRNNTLAALTDYKAQTYDQALKVYNMFGVEQNKYGYDTKVGMSDEEVEEWVDNNLTGQVDEQIKESFKTGYKEYNALYEKLKKLNKDGIISEEDKEQLEDLKAKVTIDTIDVADNIDLTAFSAKIKAQLQEVFPNVDLGDDGLISNWKETKAVIDDMVDSYELLKDARKEQNNIGKLTWQTAAKLLETDSSYWKLLDTSTGSIKLASDAEKILAQEKMDSYIAGLKETEGEYEKQAATYASIITGDDSIKAKYESITATGKQITASELSITQNEKESLSVRALTDDLYALSAARNEDWESAKSYQEQANELRTQSDSININDITVDTTKIDGLTDDTTNETNREEAIKKLTELIGEDLTNSIIENGASAFLSIDFEKLTTGAFGIINSMIKDGENATDILSFMANTVSSSAGTGKTALERLDSVLQAINKDYLQIVEHSKNMGDSLALGAKNATKEMERYYNLRKKLLELSTQMAKKGIDKMGLSNIYSVSANGTIDIDYDKLEAIAVSGSLDDDSYEKLMDYVQTISDNTVDLANNDDDLVNDAISLFETIGASQSAIVAEYQTLLTTADNDQEILEYTKKLNDAVEEQLDIQKQLLEFQKKVYDYQMEYYKGNTDSSNYQKVMSSMITNAKDQISKTKEIVQTTYNNTYDMISESYRNLYGDSWVANHQSQIKQDVLENSDYQNAVTNYIEAQKALGDLYMDDFDNKVSDIERRLKELETAKPSEWAATWDSENQKVLESGIDKIKSYYGSGLTDVSKKYIANLTDSDIEKLYGLEKTYVEVAKEAYDTLLNYSDSLTDEQITTLTEKYNEAIESIRDNTVSLYEDIKSYQENVYSALTSEVERYKDQLEEEKELVEEYYDKELEKLNDKNTAIERTNKLIELQQNLQNSMKEKTKTFRAGIGWVNQICPG